MSGRSSVWLRSVVLLVPELEMRVLHDLATAGETAVNIPSGAQELILQQFNQSQVRG